VAVRVLHILASRQRRGAETFAFGLHEAMLRAGDRSEAVALVDGADGSLPISVFGSSRFSPRGAMRLRSTARRSDVVIAHGSDTLLACGTVLSGSGIPFVYANIGDPRYWASSELRRIRLRWLLSRAVAVAAISPTARQVLADDFAVAGERIVVIPNGRDADRFRPAPPDATARAREKLGLPAAGPVLVMVGALSAEKRVDVAIDALALLPAVSLVVAGDGPLRGRLLARAQERAPGRVRFVGTVERPEDVYAAADALVLTSDSEGVPGVLIEAGLAGLPAVATDVGFVADVIVDGRTGRLVPSGRPDLVAAALMDVIPRRDVMGAEASSWCQEHFGLAMSVARWRELVDVVASGGRRVQLH
jgi:glycosyltransferase involved in cell wall biosynthesis